MKNQTTAHPIALLAFLTIVTLTTLLPSACHKDKEEERLSGNAAVFPPNERPFDKSYADWTIAWWQEFLPFDCANNPFNNPAPALFYQSGSVYFLVGLAQTGASVHINVPHGKALRYRTALSTLRLSIKTISGGHWIKDARCREWHCMKSAGLLKEQIPHTLFR